MSRLTFTRFLMIMLVFVAFPLSAKTYLVAVGICKYQVDVNDLVLPENDARAFVQMYSKNIGSSNLQSVVLLGHQATKENIVSKMKAVFSQAKKDDIVIFFFSGHGYPGGFLAYDSRMPYSEVRSAMASSRSVNKMIFADACYSGKMRTGGRKQSAASDDAKKANIMLFLSSRENETSLEKPFMKNGLFTTYLCRALSGRADADRNRIITARELFDYVHRGVVDHSGKRQHPVMWGSFNTSMPVIRW